MLRPSYLYWDEITGFCRATIAVSGAASIVYSRQTRQSTDAAEKIRQERCIWDKQAVGAEAGQLFARVLCRSSSAVTTQYVIGIITSQLNKNFRGNPWRSNGLSWEKDWTSKEIVPLRHFWRKLGYWLAMPIHMENTHHGIKRDSALFLTIGL
jgi:hypothetical protein